MLVILFVILVLRHMQTYVVGMVIACVGEAESITSYNGMKYGK
jgi:hypothetical protein